MSKRVNSAVWSDTQQRWRINVQKDGTRKTFYSSTPGRAGQREANAKADAWLDQNLSSPSVRCRDLLDSFLEDIKERTSASNYTVEKRRVDLYIMPAIGHMKISSITEQRLQKIINTAFAKGLSKKSLMNLRSTITAWCKFCRKSKSSTLYPEDLSIPKGAAVGEKNILQPQDLQVLFSVDDPCPYLNAYRFQILTGLRPGELLGLRWADVSGQILYVRRSINYLGETTKGKNENASRKIYLNDLAVSILQHQWKETGSEKSIFCISDQQAYRRRLSELCVRIGIPHITPYELRHTFVSIVKELPEGSIKPLVGHSKNMDTFGIYGHELDGEMQSTSSAIGNIFSEILNAK